MVNALESEAARTPLGAALKAGIDQLSYNQTITFTQYVKKVMPLDGFVFWVRGDLVSPPVAQLTREVMGSFHYTSDRRQDEQEVYVQNKVVFSSQEATDFMNEIDPQTLWIGKFGEVRFAFSYRHMRYKQADLWHYVGDAIYADMASQIIDDASQLTSLALVVSNSLPVWLGFNTFRPDWPFYPTNLPATLYPSHLSPLNIDPPFATVHIGENDTAAIASAPGFDSNLSQTQLTTDRVRITLWGVDNDGAQDFIAIVDQFSVDTGLIGIMNVPIVRDAKRTQRELETLAQKKVIEYEVSYIQSRLRTYARQLITSAIPTYYPMVDPGYSPYRVARAAITGSGNVSATPT